MTGQSTATLSVGIIIAVLMMAVNCQELDEISSSGEFKAAGLHCIPSIFFCIASPQSSFALHPPQSSFALHPPQSSFALHPPQSSFALHPLNLLLHCIPLNLLLHCIPLNLLLNLSRIVNRPEVCALPSDTGPCRASIKRYFYNVQSGACEQFVYGGCQGNRNNFKTLLQCQLYCSKLLRHSWHAML